MPPSTCLDSSPECERTDLQQNIYMHSVYLPFRLKKPSLCLYANIKKNVVLYGSVLLIVRGQKHMVVSR